jgi:hypothetical protein
VPRAVGTAAILLWGLWSEQRIHNRPERCVP